MADQNNVDKIAAGADLLKAGCISIICIAVIVVVVGLWMYWRSGKEPQQAETDAFKIVDVTAKVTERTNTWWRYSWQLTVRNNTSKTIRLSGRIDFQDAQGFIIDTYNIYNLVLQPNETKVHRDFQLVRMPGAKDVKQYSANLQVAG